MTVSSSPRGEHPGTVGRHWSTQLVSLGEIVVEDDDGDSPFGWRELEPPPTANRETRRAAQRRNR